MLVLFMSVFITVIKKNILLIKICCSSLQVYLKFIVALNSILSHKEMLFTISNIL